jgi:hypothetical protein
MDHSRHDATGDAALRRRVKNILCVELTLPSRAWHETTGRRPVLWPANQRNEAFFDCKGHPSIPENGLDRRAGSSEVKESNAIALARGNDQRHWAFGQSDLLSNVDCIPVKPSAEVKRPRDNLVQ